MADQQASTHPKQDEGYNIKTAPRSLLEEDLEVVRQHVLPRMERLEQENAALREELEQMKQKEQAAAAGGSQQQGSNSQQQQQEQAQ